MIDIELTKVNVKEIKQGLSIITISPLPQGYGMTLGNALRRVLLSSLPGAAVTAVKIKGATHEFSSIKGVKDSIVDIILNLKQVYFKKHNEEAVTLKLHVKKEGEIYAKDFAKNADVEVITPDVYITTLEKGTEFSLEITVETGIGYAPVAEKKRRKDSDPNLIHIDSFFSPIRKVKYDVTDTRVGQDTDLDQLVLEIETDGSITPEDALAKAAGALRNYFTLLDPKFLTAEKTAENILEAQKAENEEEKQKKRRKYTPVEILKLSPRTLNALVNNNVCSVEQLVTYTTSKLSNLKGFGARAMTEVKDSLKKNNLFLADEAPCDLNNIQ